MDARVGVLEQSVLGSEFENEDNTPPISYWNNQALSTIEKLAV